jgi:tetratricopeptide (TPR) repeat protein
VGEAIEALYPGGLQEHVEQLAYHYERSGADEKAVAYLLKAGEKARRAYLNEAAIGYFQRALERLEGSALGEARKEWKLAALRGLGLIHHGIGRELEAEGFLEQAVTLGHEIGLAPREMVYLYHSLGDAVFWQQYKFEQVLRVGQAGLALVEDDPESVEAVMMNGLIALGHLQGHAGDKAWEIIRRIVPSLERLPYSEELRSLCYWTVAMYSGVEDNVEEATRWLRIFEQKAQQHRDFRALADVVSFTAIELLRDRGDLRGAVSPYLQALELYGKIGGAKHQSSCLDHLGGICLSLGRLKEAEEYANRGRESAEVTGEIWLVAPTMLTAGTVLLCQDRPEQATLLFQQAADLLRESRDSSREARMNHALGRARLAQGRRLEAVRHFQEAAACAALQNEFLLVVLSGLEEACGQPEEFRAFCQRFREEHPQVTERPLVQWYLEPSHPHFGFSILDFGLPTSELQIQNPKSKIQNAPWVWLDPFDDCGYRVGDGLEIHAANGRDLWRLNRSAPRLLRPITGDFAVQAVCVVPSKEKPAMGGLLLWKDKGNYLRLEHGTRGEHEISFQGRLGNKDGIIGRGRLSAEPIFLRLERRGSRVHALCSADGQSWFTVGQAEFPIEDPLEVGLHAIGNIDRTLYPGAYPEGTAIRFESFGLWTNDE